MKAIQIVKPGEIEVIDVEKPVITDKDNVLVKMVTVGICASDMGIFKGTNAAATYPRIFGHEMVGVVEDVGHGVTRVKKGDRVIIDQVINCGHCWACKHGRGNVCQSLQVRGVHIDGGCREYQAVPADACYILPDSIADRDAIMIEPSTIGLQCCSRAELKKEDTVLIYGSGALGSSILRIARLSGAKIIVSDVVDEKLEEAKKNGATYTINSMKEDFQEKVREYTDGYGTTVSIDAACLKTSLLELLKATGNTGRVMTMGFSVAPTDVNQFLITAKELDVRGSRLQNKKFGEAIDLINEGKLNLNGTVSHTYPFLKAKEAFAFVASGDPSIRKVALTF